ncbi:conserved hypothetical protein [Ricinus communis]|uniref:RNase H type-1 domain-containing protein n=1 Tax=Ricinus communis TaxID=3988 RepID=B9RSG2_RICCO|nr:conserved hypothetical protein [Ricinus communis]
MPMKGRGKLNDSIFLSCNGWCFPPSLPNEIRRCLGINGSPRRTPAVMFVVNTDGSALGALGPAGAGGLFRNPSGYVMGAFAFSLGTNCAFFVELNSASFAVCKAWEVGWLHLWLESDSIYVVHLFRTKGTSVLWELRLAWSRYLHFVQQMDFRVSYVFREGNKPTDMFQIDDEDAKDKSM